MSEEVKAPFYSYEDLRRKANAFLVQHHPDGTIPVPIEEIVEFQLDMDIVPTPGLRNLLEVDGFVTSNLREIWIDQYVYDNYASRYRFTLAHEVGHCVLHSDVFSAQLFRSIDEWKTFVNSIPDKEHSWLEYQSYAFAGLVLVPKNPLELAARECVDKVKSEGIDLYENWDFAWSRIAAFLAKQFDVSSQVIEKRLEKDGLPNDLRD
ncbi:MAG: ImmA/IrrE family metallo-endopeptidase [Planctomycetota bacterium]